MKILPKILLPLLLLGGFIQTGCKKDIKYAQLDMRMQDAPNENSPYDQVNIDLREVQIHYTDGRGWTTTRTNAGIYDLLQLQNLSIATVAWDDKLEAGRIDAVRYVLGSENYVIDHGVRRNLTLKPGAEAALTVKIEFELSASYQVDLLEDFSAEKSVVDNGDGTLWLVPVIYLSGKLLM